MELASKLLQVSVSSEDRFQHEKSTVVCIALLRYSQFFLESSKAGYFTAWPNVTADTRKGFFRIFCKRGNPHAVQIKDLDLFF